ncbi:MAG: N-acetylmuramoyl-L-alanine amidase-like domain-containing protein [Blastocatellia bacterium]
MKQALFVRNQTTGFEPRLKQISGLFLGRPYVENPLEGGPQSRERFLVAFDEFDCVTYVETVLAVVCSRTADQFYRKLRALRYRNGRVDWSTRNHFMTDWLRRNVARGVLTDVTRGLDAIAKTRTLVGVPGIKPLELTFRCFPKRRFAKVSRRIQTGDLILFVSTRKTLDVFHAGILIRNDNNILLRHATRSAGKVIEQDLRDFLRTNRMSGFILARPKCRP